MRIRSRSAVGFRLWPLHRRKRFSLIEYLSKKIAFWTALFSLFAFALGNLIGLHGFSPVWHAVFGDDEILYTYDGTVDPVEVPDYAKWAKYGGAVSGFTADQVPRDFWLPLPKYDAELINEGKMASVYSVGFAGSYKKGGDGDGDHPGVDIRNPLGTPVKSAMNGLVVMAGDNGNGYGNMLLIETKNAPDPNNPSNGITVYTLYGHMSKLEATKGQIVKKGDEIGKVGATGFATGNHLHFQINRDPDFFWPFTTAEVNAAGLNFVTAVDAGLNKESVYEHAISPVLYVQAHYAPLGGTLAASSTKASSSARVATTAAERVAARLKAREDKLAQAVSSSSKAVVAQAPVPVASSSSSVATQVLAQHTAGTVLASADVSKVAARASFSRIEFQTDDTNGARREWKTVKIVFYDSDGKQVLAPALKSDIYLRTAYGQADFKPDRISELDIKNGVATFQMLPHSPTVVVQLQPNGDMSMPLTFQQ